MPIDPGGGVATGVHHCTQSPGCVNFPLDLDRKDGFNSCRTESYEDACGRKIVAHSTDLASRMGHGRETRDIESEDHSMGRRTIKMEMDLNRVEGTSRSSSRSKAIRSSMPGASGRRIAATSRSYSGAIPRTCWSSPRGSAAFAALRTCTRPRRPWRSPTSPRSRRTGPGSAICA